VGYSHLRSTAANEWSSALRLGEQLNTTEPNGKVRPNALGAVDGLPVEAIGALPAAIYMTDSEGRLTFYNEAAAELWGCHPELGESKFCGSWKLYWPDGTPLPHDECPMAMTLRQKRPIRGMEAVAERPDGTRVPFIPYPTPLFDANGKLTGAVNLLVDITDRRQAENEKQRLAAIVTSSEDAIVSEDLNGLVTTWNPGAERVFGYSAEEMIGKPITLLIPAHLLQEETIILEQIARGEPVDHFETSRVRKDGTLVKISLSVSPIRNLQGRVIGGSKIARDITKRKEAELALAEREAQLALAGKAARVGSFVVDYATLLIQASPGFAAIHGLAEEAQELTCEEWRAHLLPDDVARFEALRSRVFAEQRRELNMEYRIVGTDGKARWIESRGLVSYDSDGRPARLVGVHIDITERKQSEQALAERNLQLALAGKAGRVGSFAYDIDTEIMQISAGYAAIHGFPDGTTEIARSEWQLGVHPEDRVRWEALRSRAYRERWDEYSGEYRTVRSGSEYRWIEARVFVSYDGDGRPRRAVGVDIDITARKRAEEQQGTLIAELDHRVKNVLATVSAIAAHTRDASTSMDHFVAALDGRIRSMATTHELLSARRWHGVSLIELARGELAPYATRNNTEIGGPEVTLSAEAGQVVSMALHELTTNAAKHGALSVHDGRVSVHWHHASSGNVDARIAIEWQETGGPAVQAPDTCGYGMEVIRDLIPYELGGTVDLAFAPDGLRCRLEVPASWLHGGALHGTLSAAGQPLHAVP